MKKEIVCFFICDENAISLCANIRPLFICFSLLHFILKNVLAQQTQTTAAAAQILTGVSWETHNETLTFLKSFIRF